MEKKKMLKLQSKNFFQSLRAEGAMLTISKGPLDQTLDQTLPSLTRSNDTSQGALLL